MFGAKVNLERGDGTCFGNQAGKPTAFFSVYFRKLDPQIKVQPRRCKGLGDKGLL
jgi:hypothetical protein